MNSRTVALFFSVVKINLPIQIRHVSMPSCIGESLNHLHTPSFYTQQNVKKVVSIWQKYKKNIYNKNECNQFAVFLVSIYFTEGKKNILLVSWWESSRIVFFLPNIFQ